MEPVDDLQRSLGRVEGKLDTLLARQRDLGASLSCLDKRVSKLERANDYTRGIRVTIAAGVGAVITVIGYSIETVIKWFYKV